MLSPKPELIWKGRIQLGDEPGSYGDACYSGLGVELPATLERTSAAGPNTTTLVVRTEDVETFSGYPGHLIAVMLYEPDPAQEFHWQERTLREVRLTSADNNRKDIEIDLTGSASPHFISVRIRIDTEVPPGLYDDFVVTRFAHRSEDFRYVASFGFKSPPPA